MQSIPWTPGQSQLADALTKNKQEIWKLFNSVLQSGIHEHPSISYAVTSDIPGAVTNCKDLNSAVSDVESSTTDDPRTFYLRP